LAEEPAITLTEREVERLIEAAKQNRCGHRDATAILVAYRHGLRASEVVALRWDDIDLTTGRLAAIALSLSLAPAILAQAAWQTVLSPG
jgi:integrase